VEITEANLGSRGARPVQQVPVVVLLCARSEASAQLGDVLPTRAATAQVVAGTVNVDAVPRVAQMFGVQAVRLWWRWRRSAVVEFSRVCSRRSSCAVDRLTPKCNGGKLDAGDAGDAATPWSPKSRPRTRPSASASDAGTSMPRCGVSSPARRQPDDPEAKGAVRQLASVQRATAHRPDAIAVADAAPDDIDAAFAAADVDVCSRTLREHSTG